MLREGGFYYPDINKMDLPKIIGRIQLGCYDEYTLRHLIYVAGREAPTEEIELLITSCYGAIEQIKQVKREARLAAKKEEEEKNSDDVTEEILEASRHEEEHWLSERERR